MIVIFMDNKSYQAKYRKLKEKRGWKYFSVIVPPECYMEIKKFYLKWKMNNLEKWNLPKEPPEKTSL